MPRATKEDWLDGSGDLEEAVIEDVPVKGKSIKVRALAAKFANEAQTKATETRAMPDGTGLVTVNKARMEILQFTHGVIEPRFTEKEAEQVAEKFGPAFNKVIDKLDAISAIDKEAIEEAQARFPSKSGETAAPAPKNGGDPAAGGSAGSDVPVRAGAGDGDAG